jgi:predicted transcriptional regulator
MREPADWMATGPDDRILEYLRDNDRAIPSSIATETGFTNKHVAQRCELLSEHGLLAHEGNRFYSLATTGERYLDGDLDAAELSADEQE